MAKMTTVLMHEKVEEGHFPSELLAQIRRRKIPEHVAIIMDGNRRWARRECLQAMAGHWKGAEVLTDVVSAAAELGIKVLTVFAFSTENWKRPPVEIKALMRLLKTYLQRQRQPMIDAGVRFGVIGDIGKFPLEVQDIINGTVAATAGGNGIDLVVALNYGARDEMKRAVSSIVYDCLENKMDPTTISESLIASYLDTAKWNDPDLLIRTSGECRVSNFLLWQISYAEVVLTETLWPDFAPKDLLSAVLEYQKREVRQGK